MNAPKPRPSEEEMWAGPSGDRWLANALRFEETLKPAGQALIERAAVSPGEHVLDIGCGAGATTLDIARRVIPCGTVTGLDISQPLINECQRRADAARFNGAVRFVRADAARTSLPPGKADCLVSRFGSMFFTDPYAAFAHLRTLIRPGGRLALACWAPVKQNPWMFELRTIIAAHVEIPTPPPRTPGPFAFDEPDYLRDILTKATFRNIDISPWQTRMFVGGPGSDPDSAANFLMSALSIAQRALDAPEPVQKQIRFELRNRMQSYMTPDGVQMPGSLFLATAHA